MERKRVSWDLVGCWEDEVVFDMVLVAADYVLLSVVVVVVIQLLCSMCEQLNYFL